jgi:hypothetical protein
VPELQLEQGLAILTQFVPEVVKAEPD